jgi:hypothetical protein
MLSAPVRYLSRTSCLSWELVLDDFVDTAAFTRNYMAHFCHAADDEVEKSGEEQVACRRRIL